MIDISNIRVVVTREGDMYVAQCVDYDICSQAPDIDTLVCRMTAVVNAELEESERRTGTPFGDIDPAPAFYAEVWERQAQALRPNDSPIEYKFAA